MADYKIRHYMPQFPVITPPMTDAKYRPPILLGEAHISNIDFTLSLDSVAGLTYDLSFDNDIHSASEPCIPYVTDFELVRNGENILAGLHTGVDYEISQRFLTAAGKGWKHWYERNNWLFVPPDLAEDSDPTFVKEETDTITIAYDLLREFSLSAVALDHEGKNLYVGVMITRGSEGSTESGLDIDYYIEYADQEDILSKVNALSSRHPGFDWDITVNREFVAWTPFRHRFRSLILEEGVNITGSRFSDEGPSGSIIYGTADTGDGPRYLKRRTQWQDPNSDLISGSVRQHKHRMLQTFIDYGAVETEESLEALTLGDMRRTLRQTEVITTKVIQEQLDFYNDLQLGDIFPVVIPNEHKPVNGSFWRLTNIHGTVDSEGNENITLTLDNSNLAYEG